MKVFPATFLLLLACLMAGSPAHAQFGKQAPRLALLIAVPWPGEAGIHNDAVAMYDALKKRGFRPEEILTLDGPASREMVLTFLTAAGRRLAGWRSGEVFLYYSGHGTLTGSTVADARPGLWLSAATGGGKDGVVFWDEVFGALSIPAAIRLTVLPDG